MDKLKIFISGTQNDMLPERDAVSRAVEAVALAESVRAEQTLSQIQSPRDWIVEQVQSCDIYVGVYSHRYGWIVPEEDISVTEYEFDLAVRLGKPILAWIRKQQSAEKNLSDFDRQQQFLSRVSDFSKGYLRQVFENTDELERWVVDALRQTLINIVRHKSPNLSSLHLPPSTSLIDLYLEEIAKQRPYILWDNVGYIERNVSKGEDYFTRIVAPYDPYRLDRDRRPETESVEDALARERKLILLGEPGLGKTTSLLHLTWDSAVRARTAMTSSQTHFEVPLYIELKYYGGELELETLIARRMNDILRAVKYRTKGCKV